MTESPSQAGKGVVEVGPEPASDAVRRRLENQRTVDTKPELMLRRELHARGLRYRVDRRPLQSLRRRADLVFGPSRVAVFVDGCFWHGCPTHFVPPKSNALWWREKIDRNVARDRETDIILEAHGWLPLRIWEHAIRADTRQCADLVDSRVTDRR